MIKLPNGKVARTLPEQVGYVTAEIDKIWGFLDGINVQDNLVKVAASSGTLDADEMAIVSREVAFIEYNGNLYIKANTTVTEFVFKQIALSASDQGTYNILQSFRIVVTKASGAYAYSSNTVLSLYNKSEMDSLLAAKADDSATTAALAGKADLSGANFTGGITSPSIIEDMAGYGFSLNGAIVGYTLEGVYAGVVKNGNKITFVAALNVTRTANDLTGNPNLFKFEMPSSVGAKLIPTMIGGYSYLANFVSQFWKSGWSKADVVTYFNKNVNSSILFNADSGINTTLEKDVKYYLRVEATFLLSDNLAS